MEHIVAENSDKEDSYENKVMIIPFFGPNLGNLKV